MTKKSSENYPEISKIILDSCKNRFLVQGFLPELINLGASEPWSLGVIL